MSAGHCHDEQLIGCTLSSNLQKSHPSISAYGKLPWAGDFLHARLPASGAALRDWLEHAVAIAAGRGEPWRRAFDAGAHHAFLLPAGDRTLAGVIAPSRDEVGRRFPFVVYTEIDSATLGSAPQVAPLLLGDFLESAGTAIGELMSGGPVPLAEQVARIVPPDLSEIPLHLEGYAAWAQSASLHSAGQAIFGGVWREGMSHALFVCIESIRPFFGREAPPTPLSVRLPVGAGFAGAVAFWMHVIRACSGWSSTVPASFWSFEPRSAAATIHFGAVSASAFADLWEAEPTTETLSNLATGTYASTDFLAAARPDVAALIENDGASVLDLLNVLSKTPT